MNVRRVIYGLYLVLLVFSTAIAPSLASGADTYTRSEQYDRAYNLYYKKGNTERALEILDSLSSDTSSSELNQKIHYLTGRILKSQKRTPLVAIKHLYKAYARYKTNHLTDDVLYYIGDIFEKQLDQSSLAVPYFQVVKDHLENSDFHSKAQKRYKSLVNQKNVSPTSYGLHELPRPRMKLNFEKVELTEFISTYSRLTGKNFTYKPGIKGKITFISQEGIPLEELFDVFLNSLDMYGYTVTKQGSVYRIQRKKQAFKDGIPPFEKSGGLQTRLFKMDGLHWNDVKNLLTNILPSRRKLNYFDSLNRVLVSTTPQKMEHVARVFSSMKRMDLKSNQQSIIELSPSYGDANTYQKRLQSILRNFMGKRTFSITLAPNKNKLYVIAPKSRRDLIERTFRRIDQDMDQSLKIEVFRLEYAQAGNVVNKINNLLKVLPGNSTSNNVSIVKDNRLNAVVVSTVSDNLMKIIKKTINKMDHKRPEKPSKIRIFKVENSKPKSIAKQVRNLLKIKPDQFKTDSFKLVANKRQDAIVVAAEDKDIFPIIKNMIQDLDQNNKDAPKNVRVYRLQHADVNLVAKKLNKLKNVLPGERTGGKVRILPDERQRAIVVAAESRKVFSSVKKVINELDREDAKQPNRTHVYEVRNTKAGPLSEKLNFLFKNSQNSEVRVTADEQTNSLIVSAPPDKFENIKKTITQLDSPKKQILVDVAIVEASTEKVKRLGIDLGTEGNVGKRESILGTNFGLRSQAQQGGLFGLNAGILEESGNNVLSVLNAYSKD
ncbi:MAG: secretin N-terminal domain-containing protein, partial [bacterium]